MSKDISRSVNNISERSCTGCMMCGDICSKKAITYNFNCGFWYPSINENLCVNCGICRKKCPGLNAAHNVQGPIACYGVKSKNEQTRWYSTSGGFFSELAYAFIKENGVCVGAKYTEDNDIVHSVEKDIEGLKKLRQSKYAQSNISGIYLQVKSLLIQGNSVLFCGTPCQVEALKAFLGKNYNNLLTMDFVCLGICSPVVYRKYLDFMESKYKSKITRVWFKNKFAGWRGIGVRLDFANGKRYQKIGGLDLFMIAFVEDAIAMRKCCETCKFRKIPHNSDFTVADFWGIEKVNPSIDDDLGLSALFLNTQKGAEWFKKISNKLDYFQTTIQQIAKGNFSTLTAKDSGKNREMFLREVERMPLDMAIQKYGFSYSLVHRVMVNITYYKTMTKKLVKKLVKMN